MKKFLSIILSTTIFLTSISIGVTAYADEVESNSISNFVDNACDIIQEYDSDKNFEVADEDSSLLDFQTCRLIVRAKGVFDTNGAIEHVKGFDDIHILQYENEKSTELAYKALQNEKNVISVSIDKIISPLQSDEDEDENEEDDYSDVFPESTNGHLCDWSTERTQTAQVNNYIKDKNLPLTNITIGVIDSGVDYNHEFLQGRIVRTRFNSTTDGVENDELDLVVGHGTAVSSVIVDNSPKSVSVAVYRVLSDEGSNSTLGICLGIIEAVNDDVDLINMSLWCDNENDLVKSAVEFANENSIPIICSAGNDRHDIVLYNVTPSIFETTISVSASNKNNRYCYWSNSGLNVDLSAPGDNINVAVPNNKYTIWAGTSFSSPLVCSAVALIKTVYPNYSYDKIIEKLKEYATPLEMHVDGYIEDVDGNIENVVNYEFINAPFNEYGYGMIQLGEIFGLDKIQSPKVNFESGNYADEITVEIESAYPVYYTLDGSYPTVSSELYSAPITITKDTDLRAIAYNENAILKYSDETECEYQIFQTGTDDMFEIDENGCITKYIGNVTNLLVPDKINGIEVKSFNKQVFNDDTLTKLVLPNTISETPTSAFRDNKTIQYVNTGSAKIIQNLSFSGCKALYKIDMPNVEGIENDAFNTVSSLYGKDFLVNAPKLKYIKTNGFYHCSSFYINAPNLETLYHRAFNNSGIVYADFPNLKSVLKNTTIGYSPFYECSSLKYLNLPNLDYSDVNNLLYKCNYIQYLNLPKYTGKLSVSSTYDYLTYCNVTKETATLSGLNYMDIKALGGSIRVTDAGLRFGFSFDETQTEKVDEYGFIYSIGDVDETSLTVENVDNKSIRTLIANNRITHDDNTTTFNIVFKNVPKTSYDVCVSARAYVKVNGMYFYSDTINYSYSQVATLVLEDETINQDTKDAIKKILEV